MDFRSLSFFLFPANDYQIVIVFLSRLTPTHAYALIAIGRIIFPPEVGLEYCIVPIFPFLVLCNTKNVQELVWINL